MFQVNVTQLHEDNRDALSLTWLEGRGSEGAVRRDAAAAAAGTLVGYLNLTHPNSIQVVGAYEAPLFEGDSTRRGEFAERLFSASPAAVILADGLRASNELLARAAVTQTPLFATPASAARVIEKLS